MSTFKKLKKRHFENALHELNDQIGQDLSNTELAEKAIKMRKTKDEFSDSQSEKSDLGEEANDVEDKESVRSEGTPEDNKPVDFKEELRAFKDSDPLSKEWKNRQRVLIVCQRGERGHQRRLMEDLVKLIPHCKTETKIERKGGKDQIDELCYERSCNNFLYFETRSHSVVDHYMWLSKSPNGPSFKFSLSNIKTMGELKLTGNCLKYSRPFLSFDGSFEDPKLPHLSLCKELLSHTFNTPKNHPKSKPFIDHVIQFSYFEGAIWFRCYQVLNQNEEMFRAGDDISQLVLIEIGPRFTMTPIKAF
jgi:ribosome biogenesis protein BRX1